MSARERCCIASSPPSSQRVLNMFKIRLLTPRSLQPPRGVQEVPRLRRLLQGRFLHLSQLPREPRYRRRQQPRRVGPDAQSPLHRKELVPDIHPAHQAVDVACQEAGPPPARGQPQGRRRQVRVSPPGRHDEGRGGCLGDAPPHPDAQQRQGRGAQVRRENVARSAVLLVGFLRLLPSPP